MEQLVDKLWGGEHYFENGDGEKQWPREPITAPQIDYIFEEQYLRSWSMLSVSATQRQGFSYVRLVRYPLVADSQDRQRRLYGPMNLGH